jgi:hypothetical protein
MAKCYAVCVTILKDPVKFNNKIVSRIKLRSLNINENIQISNNTLHNIEISLETINSQLWHAMDLLEAVNLWEAMNLWWQL